jgi:hypothetical protein
VAQTRKVPLCLGAVQLLGWDTPIRSMVRLIANPLRSPSFRRHHMQELSSLAHNISEKQRFESHGDVEREEACFDFLASQRNSKALNSLVLGSTVVIQTLAFSLTLMINLTCRAIIS